MGRCPHDPMALLTSNPKSFELVHNSFMRYQATSREDLFTEEKALHLFADSFGASPSDSQRLT